MPVYGPVGAAVDADAVVDAGEVVAVDVFEGTPKRGTGRLGQVDADEFEPARTQASDTVAKGGAQRSPMAT